MSSSTDPTAPPEDSAKDALAAELIRIRNRLDTFELPMTMTTKVVRPAAAPGSAVTTTVCVHHSISVFGVEVVSWDTCETTKLELA